MRPVQIQRHPGSPIHTPLCVTFLRGGGWCGGRASGGDVGPARSLLFSEGGGIKCWVM